MSRYSKPYCCDVVYSYFVYVFPAFSDMIAFRANLVYAWEKSNVSTGKERAPKAVTYPTRVSCAETHAAIESFCGTPPPPNFSKTKSWV